VLFHGHHDILAHGEVREQCAVLEHDAPAALHGGALVRVECLQSLAEHFDTARRRFLQASDRAQKHRLATTRWADDADDLAATNIKIKMLMYDMRPISGLQVTHADDDFVGQMPISI